MLNKQRKRHEKRGSDGGQPHSPVISLPKGGGAIRGIDEKFSVNPATGTASLSVPIFTQPGRSDFYPQLLLSYDSGAGNSPFGLGWDIAVPSIARKTDKGLPKYEDAEDSDTFILSGAEDLVSSLVQQGSNWDEDVCEKTLNGELYSVQQYRPRIEGLFARIEKWEHIKTGAVHWKSVTKDNVTSIYGKTSNSKISDPEHSRVFKWLLEESYDDKGNVILYEYKKENHDNIKCSLHEKNRLAHNKSCANKYLKRIYYGNTVPYERNNWLFEVVFDYGEHDLVIPEVDEVQSWPLRPDAFSSYRAGFEIRTYRLCRRVLMFHHFTELGDAPCLVRSTDFGYEENPVTTYLVSITQSGYIRTDEGTYQKKSLPPLEFEYTKPEIEDTVCFLDAESLENLPMGLDGSQYQWVDLDGEGISGILTEQGNQWFYKRNVGGGQFAPAQHVASKPSLAYLQSGQQQIMDLAGDGQKDLVLLTKSLQGIYERNNKKYWEPFTPFKNSPKISWNDSNLRLVDLNGNGLSDILITEDEAIVWYPSLGERGFGSCEMVRKSTDEEEGPALVFADGTQSIYLADMTGDGLIDIVRIRNGDMCYWPSLGYGRFGAKVAMDDSPYFDHPGLFDQNRIRLADTDGSGTTDIVYLGKDCVSIWVNQAGNSWSESHQLYTFPATDNYSFVTVVDLLGNGTACIVWSSPMQQDVDQPMCYIDLMGGKKPHLLSLISNNMGRETHLEYASSTKFYLEDIAHGTPWATKLFFPVHVVERIETQDHITKTKLVTLYTYHHGYYDGEEREFRGFGLAEQWDTESFSHFNTVGLFSELPALVEEDLFVPPVHTKTWFHTGAYYDSTNISQHYIKEYYNEDLKAALLPDTALPQGLSVQEEQEACRALKGRILRQEVYALDDSSESQHPYTVSERTYHIERVQPVQDGEHAVFYAHESEVLDYYYERNGDDPRISHKMVLEVDGFGNVTESITIGYPRRSPVSDKQKIIYDEQAEPLIVYTKSVFRNRDDSEDFYRVGVPIETYKYEITGIPPTWEIPFILSEIRTEVQDEIQKRLIGCTQYLYYKNDLTGHLELGKVGSRALLYESYQMVLTQGLIQQVYCSRVDNTLLKTESKYLFREGVWWVSSGRQIFDPDHFYLPIKFIDPFDNEYCTTYDPYYLLVMETEDPIGNIVIAENNYRTMLPELVTDHNGNLSAVKFDELGMVVATAVMGKKGKNEGDTLDHPTAILEYNLSNYKENGLPTYVHAKAREQHGQANPRWQESYTYSDGFGRQVMKKIQAEPGLAPARDENGNLLRDEDDNLILIDTSPDVRWVGTGRTVYDNKGNPVKKYEPFFSSTYEYEDEKDLVEYGVTPIFHYDPLGRLIRTDYPNGTFSKAEFDAWRQVVWDENDTVTESSWYDERMNLDPSDPEYRAAQLAAEPQLIGERVGTPTVAHLDVLGRTFLTIDDNGLDDMGLELKYPTHVTLDINGNQLVVTDARGSQAMESMFDMLNQKIYLKSVDAGERWTLNNVAGNPIRTWDSRGHQIRYIYDEIQRKTHLFVKKKTNPEFLAERTVYGEVHPDTVDLNLRGRLYQQYDQAGVVTNEEYDFKGNLLRKSRRLAKTYKEPVDWSPLANLTDVQDIANASAPLLETGIFASATEYDALNRPVRLTTPDNSKIRPTYNESNLLEKVDVQLRGVGEWIPFVKDIDYNAKGQRELITYGNGVRTEYEYDPFTFRLTNLETVRPGNALQDLSYTYDPVGNITEIRDGAQQTIFFDNAMVSPDAQYEYDALYRLIRADGREHAGLNSGMQRDHTDFPRMTLHHPNNGQAMRCYTEKYKYDEVGNILCMVHQAINGNWTRQYEYASNNNRLLSTSLPGDPDDGPFSATYDYDAHGNMIRMPHLAEIQWDFRDQIHQVDLGGGGTAYYVYNAGGQRVRKVVERLGALKEERIYLGSYEIFRRHNGSRLKLERETLHIMDDQRRITLVETKIYDEGMKVPSPTPLIRYQLNNHLGSSCLELDETGKVISYEEYYPYGTTSYHAVRGDVEVSLKRYRYIGKERDDETGLYYYGARYYVSWLGRWASCDPVGMVDGVNLYWFARNNPVRFIDPLGTISIDGEDDNPFKPKPPEMISESPPDTIPIRTREIAPTETPSSETRVKSNLDVEEQQEDETSRSVKTEEKTARNQKKISDYLPKGNLSNAETSLTTVKEVARRQEKMIHYLRGSIKKMYRRLRSRMPKVERFAQNVPRIRKYAMKTLDKIDRVLRIGAAGQIAYEQLKESTAQTQVGKWFDVMLATSLYCYISYRFTKELSYMKTKPLILTGGFIVATGEMVQTSSRAFVTLVEGIFTGNTRGVGLFHERSIKGEYGEIFKAASEAGEYWEKGIIRGLKEFLKEYGRVTKENIYQGPFPEPPWYPGFGGFGMCN